MSSERNTTTKSRERVNYYQRIIDTLKGDV